MSEIKAEKVEMKRERHGKNDGRREKEREKDGK